MSSYMFQDKRILPEKERLKLVESVHDDQTKKLLSAVGMEKGAWALEVGFGAGSILKWLAKTVGPNGHVTGIDLTTDYLEFPPSNSTIKKGDIRQIPLAAQTYDLIHARYVLIHIKESKEVLTKIVAALKPGGWLVIEDPDFSTCRPIDGTEAQKKSFQHITQAIMDLYRSKGCDGRFGATLEGLLTTLGLNNISVLTNEHRVYGATPLAKLMGMSAQQLKSDYLGTRAATAQDVDTYVQMANDPHSLAIYYSTVSVMGQKQGA